MDDLFASQRPAQIAVTDGIRQLTGFADTASLQSGLDEVLSISPWRQQQTPGGRTIRVRITNCGDYGWVSDARGYRYEATDPVTGAPWPALPEAWVQLAVRAASTAGCPDYRPNACLINRYEVGDSMGSHQDKNERDFRQPVVTVSLGLPAEFLIYGDTRGGTPA
ncbi:MAG: alpha-ketoglutarate-dependent dioxygenase AlkB, partial [Pseudomonadota bacterium]